MLSLCHHQSGAVLDEQAFRFNEREGEGKDRFAKTLGSVTGRRLTYAELTGSEANGGVS